MIHQIKDDSKKRELRLEDEEEDFLDEGKIVEVEEWMKEGKIVEIKEEGLQKYMN